MLRTVPSAGARHAFETLVLVHRVDDLAAGLYQYHPLEHALIPIGTSADLDAGVLAACHGQEFVTQSAATFLWVAVPYRMTWRYGARGYRYLYLDAGHIGQNLYLAAEAIGAGACAVAAFDDEALDAQLDLPGEQAFALYLAAVGKRPGR
jgi:SagB-type dehydrogenase family enzyme